MSDRVLRPRPLPRADQWQNQQDNSPLARQLEAYAEDDCLYPVEEIRGIKFDLRGRLQLLLKWEGWGAVDSVWKPIRQVNSNRLLKQFLRRVSCHRSLSIPWPDRIRSAEELEIARVAALGANRSLRLALMLCIALMIFLILGISFLLMR